ncbi:helix-turn-helix domain-containing protein [uncultured Methylobacterium sp.]|uniref:helix-turn-helix domain-containing protein n=1 Tax=uncultured Methylobacterium sp. TaxID=157278 RepID=UPI0035CB9903
MYPTPTELRAGRSLLNLTQEEMAKLAGVSVRTLISVEQGRGTIAALHSVMGAMMGMGLRYDLAADGKRVVISYDRVEDVDPKQRP